MTNGKNKRPPHPSAGTDSPAAGAAPECPGGAEAPPAGPSKPMIAILVAAEAVVLAIAAGLLLYVHPVADDYSRAGPAKMAVRKYESLRKTDPNFASVSPHVAALTECMANEYKTWSGRWSGNGVSYLGGTVSDITTSYATILSIAAVVFIVCIHLFFAAVLGLRPLGLSSFAVTLSFVCLYWTTMPNTGEAFYWIPGAVETHGAVALCLLTFAGLLATARMGRTARIACAIALPLLACFAAGMHELFAMVLAAILWAATVLGLRRKTPRWWLWGATALGATVSLAVVVASPGNAIRMSQWPNHGQVLLTIQLAWSQAVDNVFLWVRDPRLWAGTLLALLAPPLQRVRPAWLADAKMKWPWVIPAGWLVLLAILFAAPGWAMGAPMPGRTLDAVYLVFLLGWLLTAMVLSDGLRKRLAADGHPPRAVLWAAAGVWCVCLVFFGNTPQAFSDLKDAGPQYDQFVRAREQIIRSAAAAGQTDLVVDRLSVWVPSFYGYDISPDPNHWANVGVARYFGLRTIRTRSLQR